MTVASFIAAQRTDAIHDDSGALAGELVDDVQQLEGLAIDGGVELEVECPQHLEGCARTASPTTPLPTV